MFAVFQLLYKDLAPQAMCTVEAASGWINPYFYICIYIYVYIYTHTYMYIYLAQYIKGAAAKNYVLEIGKSQSKNYNMSLHYYLKRDHF
jgi:hypothetical protein